MALGYNKSLGGLGSVFGVFNDASLTQSFDAFSSKAENKASAKNSSQTVLQKLGAKGTTMAPVNASSMKRDVNKATSAGDLKSVGQKAGSVKNDVKKTMASVENSYTQAQKIAHQAIGQAAENLDYNSGTALSTLGPQITTHMSDVMFDVGMGMVAPTAGDVLNAGTIAQTVSKDVKKLKPAEQRAILEEAVKLTAEHTHNQNTLTGWTKSNQGVMSDKKPVDTKGLQFKNLDVQDMADLSMQDVEQQPEMIALQSLMQTLEGVEENHVRVENAQDGIGKSALEVGDIVTAEKSLGASKMVEEASKVDELPKGQVLSGVALMKSSLAIKGLQLTSDNTAMVQLSNQSHEIAKDVLGADNEEPEFKPSQEFIAEMKHGVKFGAASLG